MLIQRGVRPATRLAALGAAVALAIAIPTAGASAAAHPTTQPAASAQAALHSAAAATPAQGQRRAALSPDIIRPATTTDYTSWNWDGYFATDSTDSTDFNSVTATWTEPSVTCDDNTAWAGFWVGTDGWWNDVVEQGGSQAQCFSGTAYYSVWWEMYPYNDIQTGFSIDAGDTITATVTYSPTTTDFTITVKDVTLDQTLTEVTPCESDQDGCPRTTAEVISEDIGGGSDTDGLYYLPDYDSITYNDISITNTAGHSGSLSDSNWNLGKVAEVSSTNITKQSTSGLSGSGTSFSTSWLHE
jgi:Peptidase A4 family